MDNRMSECTDLWLNMAVEMRWNRISEPDLFDKDFPVEFPTGWKKINNSGKFHRKLSNVFQIF